MTNQDNPTPIPHSWLDTISQSVYSKDELDMGLVAEDASVRRTEGFQGIEGLDLSMLPGYSAVGSMLVSLDFIESDDERADEAVLSSLLEVMGNQSLYVVAISRFTWLMGCKKPFQDVFQNLGSILDPEEHSFIVVDLVNRLGLSWDASNGLTVQVEPAKVWSQGLPANLGDGSGGKI